MTNLSNQKVTVVTCSKEIVERSIAVLDRVEDGDSEVDMGEFASANAVLTAVSLTAFTIQEEVDRLRSEVAGLREYKRKTDAWGEAIRLVRAAYPTSVFPDDGKSVDCQSAHMARITLESVEFEYRRQMDALDIWDELAMRDEDDDLDPHRFGPEEKGSDE